jgi:hypothetical protein
VWGRIDLCISVVMPISDEFIDKCQQRTSHRMGEKRTFLQPPRAQIGIVLAFPDFPVMTEQSLLKCSSMRTLGSCPGRIATGVLQSGPGQDEQMSMTESGSTYNLEPPCCTCSRHTWHSCEQRQGSVPDRRRPRSAGI